MFKGFASDNDPLRITVYYTAKSKSEESKNFIINQLYPVFEKLQANNEWERIKMELVPFGKLEVSVKIFH